MFDQLPETYRSKNVKRVKAVVAAAAFQVALVAAVVLVQMALPEKLGEFQLLTTLYMAPPPPPPPPAPLGPPPKMVRETPRPTTNPAATAIQPEAPRQPVVQQPKLTAVPNARRAATQQRLSRPESVRTAFHDQDGPRCDAGR